MKTGGTVYIIVEAADTCGQGKPKFTIEQYRISGNKYKQN